MRPTLRLTNGILEWQPRPDASPERRRLTEEDRQLFDTWTERYERVLKRLSPREDLSTLGREIYGWLDGGDSWLRRAREAGLTPPWTVDFVVPVQPDPLETAFLEAPWELLSDGAEPLAGNREIVFCPIRRFGPPGSEEKPSQDRLSGVFMTALPEGEADLAFESEEAGILDATSGVGIDLIVEDSGDLERLGEHLGLLGRVDVLHLSCHGALEPDPILLLEDELGKPVPATADDLDSALQPHRPRLLFLSACETAGADRLLGSLAATLVRRGMPALLGWGGTVRDDQAIQFAKELYERLSRKGRLDQAVAQARLELFSKRPSGDWHLPRLFLGAPGGGPLTSGTRKRAVKDRRKTTQKAFLDARGQVPVASPEEFVGRRRDLQRILRAYRDGAPGVLLHGIGRQGKSSLALRVVQRMPDHRPIVLFGPFDGGALLDAIAEAIAEPEARNLIQQRREEVQKSEDILVDVLVRLLEDYCAQNDERHKPLFFVLDDFEQLLEEGTPTPRRLQTRFVEPVRALLRALKRAEADSKLLITSRYTFTLPWQGRDLAEDLVDHPLPRMSDSDRRKQLRTKLRLSEAAGFDPEILPRLLKAAQGNPGLQDLLTVLLLESPEKAERAISAMEAYLAGEDTQEQEEVVAFLSNLALEELVALLSSDERELLRISTLFSLPVPETVMAKLAKDAGLSPVFERLIGLGLWEVYSPDSKESFLISGLARPHMESLSEEERREHATRTVELLFEAWGGESEASGRSYQQDLEIMSLALLAGDGKIVATCAEDAVTALERRMLNRKAAALGQEAIALLDEKALEVPLGLLRKTAELCELIGDTTTARALYGRANALIADASETGGSLEMRDHVAVLVSYSRRLAEDGRIDEALEGFEQARDLLSQAGQTRDVAVTLGDIARIKVSRGEVDEALKLHEESQRVFEALGDARSLAVNLGDIARIKVSRGEVDEALKLYEEELRIYEALGDARGRAITLGDIAGIKVSRGEVDEALKLHEEELRVYEALGDARSRALTLGDIAKIKRSRGEVDEALELHEENQRVFEALGDARSRAITLGDIAKIKRSRGEVDEALKLHEEELRIYEAQGDARSRAATLGDIARIKVSRREVDQALKLYEEMQRIFEALGDARSRAITLGDIARIKVSRGEVDQALKLHEEILRVVEELRDAKGRAVTLGYIASIKADRGEVDEALKLHEERLRVYEALGDLDGKAHTFWSLARIAVARGNYERATEQFLQSYQINLSLGSLDGICSVGWDLGQLLCTGGDITEGRVVLERSLAGFRHLRQDTMAQKVEAFLATLPPTGEAPSSSPTEQV